MGSALDWLFAVLYPQTKPSVANQAALPLAGNTLNDYRVVDDDGDGKSAAYRWEQREGEVAASWHKVADMDWGEESVLSGFIDKTLDVYVKRAGYDDLDAAGSPYTGDLAGQRIYGGATNNTHLTLYANSGDGVGAGTGYVQLGDNARPLIDSQFDLGTATYRWANIFTDSILSGTLTAAAGSITDSSGAISFDDENLSTSGNITAGTLLLAGGSITDSSGAISFGDDNIITTGNVGGTEGNFTTGNFTNVVSTNITMTGANGVVKAVAGVLSASLIADADVSATAAIALTKLEALTFDRAVVSGAAGFLEVSATTKAEIGYVSGVTSSIQTQLNGKANTSLSNLSSVAVNSQLLPSSNNGQNFGGASTRWSTAYVSNISDGTNSMTTSDLMKLRDASIGAPDGASLFWDNASSRWLPSIPNNEISHNDISNLTNQDDHTQYLLLAGRTIGQTVYGGIAASATLTLRGSSHGTSGGVVISDTLLSNATNTRDLGTTGNRWKDLYLQGQAYGLRLENVAGLPGASAGTIGRIAYDTVTKDVSVDEGGAWRRIGVERYVGNVVLSGAEASKIVTTSASIDDAREAIWQFRDVSGNNFEIMYPDITTTQIAVTLTFAVAPPAGTYRLIGVR